METNDFYLCSERKYRVHYSDDDKYIWSEEFSACQPVGVCRKIDGLAINGGKPYACRTRDSWPDEFTFDYNISNSNGGFAGEIGDQFMEFLFMEMNIIEVVILTKIYYAHMKEK